MSRLIIILLTGIIVYNIDIVAAPCQEIKQSGNTNISIINNKNKVQVKINSIVVSTPPSLRPFYDKKSVSVIETLNIIVNGNNTFVPRSVYADLFDTRKAVIKEYKKGYVLILSGADASEAYEVRVYFDAQKVTRRTMAGAENEIITQDTYYKLIVD